MKLMYVRIPSSISSLSMNSFFLCEREDSPGPILNASQVTLIQSDVVGDENVSISRLSKLS